MGIRFKKNISLAKFTAFKIGGPAKYFFVAKNKKDLIDAIKWAKQKNLPFFILGNGSNVLAPDEGFDGLVIKTQNSKLSPAQILRSKTCGGQEVQNHNLKFKTIYAGAGVKLENLVKLTVRESLSGLEWAVGIPGTIGGAIYGNAQAFDEKMSDIVKSVEVFDAKDFKVKNFSKKQCQFSLKNSIFKKNKNFIILSAVLKFKKGNKKEIQNKIKENLVWRNKKHPLNFPSAGSVFINQKSKIKNQKLLKQFPILKQFYKSGIIPSSFLIEQCGLKGKRVGDVQVSERHAGFIVNLGKAKAKNVLELIKIVKKEVRRKFKINLKEEIQIIHPVK